MCPKNSIFRKFKILNLNFSAKKLRFLRIFKRKNCLDYLNFRAKKRDFSKTEVINIENCYILTIFGAIITVCHKKGRKILDKLDMWTPWWLSKNFFDYFSFLLLSSFKTRNLWLILLLRIKHDQLSNCMLKIKNVHNIIWLMKYLINWR